MQIIHFLIAYVIIERWLFRPVVQEIQRDHEEKKQLKEKLDAQTLAVKQLEASQRQVWLSAHERFSTIEPSLKQVSSFKVVQQLPDIPELETAQKQELIDQCVTALVKEIEHVT
ncbi:MAG: hypothetical protein AB7F19_04985 [Candidatus Babeliales bacterium]